MTDAVVVGSGPNGLAGAIRLAEAGVSVRVLEAADRWGGGMRTSELTVPGLLHDDCSAFHPAALASPFFRSLHLEADGLEWLWPEVDLAHPLDDGTAGVMWRDIERTAEHLGADGPAWLRAHRANARGFDDLVQDIFRSIVHVPRHPIKLARFGLPALLPASTTTRAFRTPQARALFMGAAAHAFTRLDVPLSSAVGYTLIGAGHAHGWPVAKSGSMAIADALVARLQRLGGTVETGVRVELLDELDSPDVVLLDTSHRGALDIVGDRVPEGVRKSLRRYGFGPSAFKVDYAVEGGVPWTNEHVRQAGTVHVAGPAEELVRAEGETVKGRMPDRPYVLLGQQYLADPSRSVGDVHPVWAYAHVPHGWTGDATEHVTRQIERFAPGFRDRIVATAVRGTVAQEAYNANYVGGDISAGTNAGLHVALRPRPALDPYSLGVDGVYLCSSSTPPGGGVHGMCGQGAAESALKHLRR